MRELRQAGGPGRQLVGFQVVTRKTRNGGIWPISSHLESAERASGQGSLK